jgi:hypothetical protein
VVLQKAKRESFSIFYLPFVIFHLFVICRLSLVIRHVTIWHLPVVTGHWHLSVGPGSELVFNDK